ncbi:hypothetical protein ECANGB1_389 [Enterospora canceri]|uniref:Uncharacterized protein n=1 Tax=Enterospora canceri TaxID=1081671 RepID=A0A1Y1S837_9MICR|nr:hypothetical protein ECANGB1_389 [Enterospora canceri]
MGEKRVETLNGRKWQNRSPRMRLMDWSWIGLIGANGCIGCSRRMGAGGFLSIYSDGIKIDNEINSICTECNKALISYSLFDRLGEYRIVRMEVLDKEIGELVEFVDRVCSGMDIDQFIDVDQYTDKTGVSSGLGTFLIKVANNQVLGNKIVLSTALSKITVLKVPVIKLGGTNKIRMIYTELVAVDGLWYYSNNPIDLIGFIWLKYRMINIDQVGIKVFDGDIQTIFATNNYPIHVTRTIRVNEAVYELESSHRMKFINIIQDRANQPVIKESLNKIGLNEIVGKGVTHEYTNLLMILTLILALFSILMVTYLLITSLLVGNPYKKCNGNQE